MILVDSKGVEMLLDIFENIVKKGQPPSNNEIDNLLPAASISFMVESYSRWPDFSREGFVNVIANLANTKIYSDGVLSRLEDGFRFCLDEKKIKSLRQKVKEIVKVDFSKSEGLALTYLPPNTALKCTIYLTIDKVNPGMIYKGNISLSILDFVAERFDFSYLAHELHHSGFQYWTARNPALKSLFSDEIGTHEQIAVNMVLNLLSEGMANHYCTPNMVRVHPEAGDKHNRKIREYERNFPRMWLQIQSLLSDCVMKTASASACKEQLMSIVLDPEYVLPPVHFIGVRIIQMFEMEPTIKREEIINLCKEPSQFFSLYSKINQKNSLTMFPDIVAEKTCNLLRSSVD